MEAFLVSLSTVALAEMGDRTQLLSLVLAAQFRKPWPIIAGIFAATLANHAAAGAVGIWLGRYLPPSAVDIAVGLSMLAMAVWALKPDSLDQIRGIEGRRVFFTTFVAFFIAEIGDKTQIATIALAAAYSNLPAIVAGTTTGMMIANVPVVLAGNAFAARLPMRKIRYAAALLFTILGMIFLVRGLVAIRWT